MKINTARILSPFILVPSFLDTRLKINNALLEHCGLLCSVKDFHPVKSITRVIDTPLARLYEAIANNNYSNPEAFIIENIEDKHRGKALLSSAIGFRARGELLIAGKLLIEAFNLARKYGDLVTLYQTQKELAVICSFDGNHETALNTLETASPLARQVYKQRPVYWFDYLNSLAVELGEVGRLEEARKLCDVVLTSPFAPKYDGWHETGAELKEKIGRRASRSTVAVGSWHDEREPIRAVGNLVSLPTVERDKTCDNTKQDKQENARILIFTPKVADKTQPDSACIPIESKPMECDEGSDTEYTVNYSPVRTLTLRFVNTKGQERLKLEIRHDPDGAVADIWVRDKEGNSHSFFSACFLD
jgi:hypothetical protein